MVTSAALLLREHGVAGTSVARVLEHSGGPRGSVGFHFPGGKAEMVTDALRFAGALVVDSIQRAADSGATPREVFEALCRHYERELKATDFRAGCPVGAAAQESYDDPELGPVIAEVIASWHSALAQVLVAHGRTRAQARDLATVCIGSLEGALLIARVQRSARPVTLVRGQIGALLT
jgi:AcrR family transcriptional regulator